MARLRALPRAALSEAGRGRVAVARAARRRRIGRGVAGRLPANRLPLARSAGYGNAKEGEWAFEAAAGSAVPSTVVAGHSVRPCPPWAQHVFGAAVSTVGVADLSVRR